MPMIRVVDPTVDHIADIAKTGTANDFFMERILLYKETQEIAKASHRKRTMRFTPQPAWYPEHDIRKSYPLQSTSN